MRFKHTLSPDSDYFNKLDKDIRDQIVRFSRFKAVQSLLCTSKSNYQLFKSSSKRALIYVIRGNLEALQWLTIHHPEELLEKGTITDLSGRKFKRVSAWQLKNFLCDAHMKYHLLQLIPKEMKPLFITQEVEMGLGQGGADLIKLNKNPELIRSEDEITAANETIISFGKEHQITIPLLENPDGIIFHKNRTGEWFYYINRETKEIRLLSPSLESEDDKQDYEAFKESFRSMEDNSGRRSSDNEHSLIKKIMKCELVRQGIHYEHKGITYRDSQSAFRLINAFRTCIRLDAEADENGERDKVFDYWCKEIADAQVEQMWLLQRICEQDQPFHPLPKQFNSFKRGFAFYDCQSGEEKQIFSEDELFTGFGSAFALYKADHLVARSCAGYGHNIEADLVGICQLVKDSKFKIVQYSSEDYLELARINHESISR